MGIIWPISGQNFVLYGTQCGLIGSADVLTIFHFLAKSSDVFSNFSAGKLVLFKFIRAYHWGSRNYYCCYSQCFQCWHWQQHCGPLTPTRWSYHSGHCCDSRGAGAHCRLSGEDAGQEEEDCPGDSDGYTDKVSSLGVDALQTLYDLRRRFLRSHTQKKDRVEKGMILFLKIIQQPFLSTLTSVQLNPLL